MTDATKQKIIELYEQSSGHIGGAILYGAIAVAVKDQTGEEVSIKEVFDVLREHDPKYVPGF